MKILVLNCGSSSVKYRLFVFPSEECPASGVVERVGEAGGDTPDHDAAVGRVLERLGPELAGVGAVGHRVVHGGEGFSGPALATPETLAEVQRLAELAPLHNPAALAGLAACRRRLPETPQVLVFDTAFFASLPPVAYTYALPGRYRQKYPLRRYGFHGTSHQYVAEEAARFLGRSQGGLRLVTCHLGNGASITAVRDGRAVDTSMGFTPLGGLVMGTRCGDLDPAAVLYLMEKEGLSPREADAVLNRESGVLGLSGVSNDFRTLWAEAGRGNSDAALAIEVFCHSARKFIGAYAAVLGGLDALVFTAGLGERDGRVRLRICASLAHLGVVLDEARNDAPGPLPADLSSGRGTVPVLVIPTQEELAIARQAFRSLQEASLLQLRPATEKMFG